MRSTAVPEPPELSDRLVSLRMRRLEDMGTIQVAAADGQTQRWLTDRPREGEDPAVSLERVRQAFASGQSAPLVIADAVTDAPLGLINVQFRDDRLATLAYSVFPQARGRGVAGRAVTLVCGWCFTRLGLDELRLEIDPANLASLRVAEKGGWTLVEGVTNADGELVFRRDAPDRA